MNNLEINVSHPTSFLMQAEVVENDLRMVEKFVSPSLFIVVQNDILNKDVASHNRRFSNKTKQFALIIYFFGPNVFHFF